MSHFLGWVLTTCHALVAVSWSPTLELLRAMSLSRWVTAVGDPTTFLTAVYQTLYTLRQVPDDIVLLVENCCIAEVRSRHGLPYGYDTDDTIGLHHTQQLDEAGLSHGECSALIESYALALALLAERAVGAASRCCIEYALYAVDDPAPLTALSV